MGQFEKKLGSLKGTLSGLRQFLEIGILLKMMKNAFYFTFEKLFSFSRYLSFCLDLWSYVKLA